MRKKPAGCEGCPFYKRGKEFGFVDDAVPNTAKIVLCFDRPSMKFTGDTAEETHTASTFREKFMAYAGLNPWEVGYMHLIRCKHTIGAKGKPLADAKRHCRQYDEINDDTILVTQGPMSWKVFSQNVAGSRVDWRSFYVDVPYRDGAGFRDDSGLDELFDGGSLHDGDDSDEDV